MLFSEDGLLTSRKQPYKFCIHINWHRIVTDGICLGLAFFNSMRKGSQLNCIRWSISKRVQSKGLKGGGKKSHSFTATAIQVKASRLTAASGKLKEAMGHGKGPIRSVGAHTKQIQPHGCTHLNTAQGNMWTYVQCGWERQALGLKKATLKKKNSINQFLGPVKYEDENCKGNMCSALSTSCPIKQHCSAMLPWRPCDFNSSLPLSPDERGRQREGKKERIKKIDWHHLAFVCDPGVFASDNEIYFLCWSLSFGRCWLRFTW